VIIASQGEASLAAKLGRAPWRPFADLRTRCGIKLGLAGILALFTTQVLRLQHANWAVLTVLILMLAKYVGASAIKAVMRVLGTIAGALIGIWLVGDYTSTPEIFLPVLFLIVAYATYKSGKYPDSKFSYAYFLLGVTTVAVVTDGVVTPDQVWQIGLDRALEILIGVGSSLLVTALVWPRYAREDFVEAERAALQTVRELFAIQAYFYRTKARVDYEEVHQHLVKQLFALRNLLHAGSSESVIFFARISNYDAFLVSIIDLSNATLDMRRWTEGKAFIVNHMRHEHEALEEALYGEFVILTEPLPQGKKRRSSNLNEVFAAFEAKAREIRDHGILSGMPTGIAIEFGGYFDSLHSVHDNLNGIRSAMEGLPRSRPALPEARPCGDRAQQIDWFWVKAGIKGGLAAVIAVILVESINPPGAAVIPIAAFVLGSLGLRFLSAGGTGDLRAFQNGVIVAAGLVICVVFLLLITPILASYTAMNVALFLILFGFGFLTARVSGVNRWMLVTFYAISVLVGLNPQQPISSQTIIDAFIGILIGVGISAVVSRVVWPVLPQRVLRDRLLALIALSKALLRGEPQQERIRTELATLSVEALHAAQQIRISGCAAVEKAKLLAFIRALQSLVMQIAELVSRRNSLPEITRGTLRPGFDLLEVECGQVLDVFAECFREGVCRREFPNLRGALSGMFRTIAQIRDSGILDDRKFAVPMQVLDLASRYHASASTLEDCIRLLRTLELRSYWGDYAL